MYKKNMYKYKKDGNTVISQHKPTCEYELMYRLIAQCDDYILTNYIVFTKCIDIPVEDLELWFEVHKDDINVKVSQLEELSNSISNINNEIQILSKMDKDLIATAWEIDDRLYEVEWALSDAGISNQNILSNPKMKGVSTMALSKFEQAKIIIMSGDYDRNILEGQLSKYLTRGIITKEEYDTLVSMMDAREFIANK